jgi:hypothetical protein
MADRAVADKVNEFKPKNADDVSGWLYHNYATKQSVGMCDCCLQGIQPCKCKGNGHQ